MQVGVSGTAARGINDDGTITGFITSNGTLSGFVGSAAGGFQLLQPPGATDPGASTVCEGINNAAQVVCAVTDANGSASAFIGTPHGN